MAAIGATSVTLADWAKRLDPDQKSMANIVELLNQTNEVVTDMTFTEGNLPTGHRTTVRTGIPSATWRLLNYGVARAKSTTAQVTDSCGMLETYSVVDKALADLNGNTAAFRLSEDKAFIEGMNQQIATAIFYGDVTVYPERFVGLVPRYNDLNSESGDNVIDGSGTGSDNTSIWLVQWGDMTTHGIFPKGSQAGLLHRDLGEDTVLDAASNEYQAYRSHYKWDVGLTVRDWRYNVRIANIDVSDLNKGATSNSADITDLMTRALELPPNLTMGKPVFYANRTITSMLRRQLLNKTNALIGVDEFAGKKVLTFGGVPVRRTDALVNTEATVTT